MNPLLQKILCRLAMPGAVLVLAGCAQVEVQPKPGAPVVVSQTVPTPGLKAYDIAFLNGIEARWDDLLQHTSYNRIRGKVVLQFCLHSDGRISDVKVVSNTAGVMESLLCQKAVFNGEPYPAWPPEVREAVGREFRTFSFAFIFSPDRVK